MGINFEYFDASNSLPQIFWSCKPDAPRRLLATRIADADTAGTTGLPGPSPQEYPL